MLHFLFGRQRYRTLKLKVPRCDCEWCHFYLDQLKDRLEQLESRLTESDKKVNETIWMCLGPRSPSENGNRVSRQNPTLYRKVRPEFKSGQLSP